MIWVKPDFDILKPGKDKYQIGNIKGTNQVGVNSNFYFLEFENNTKLTNTQNVELELLQISYDHLPELKLSNENILLNIDLDYLSTENPMEHLLLNYYNISQEQAYKFAAIYDPLNYCFDKVKDFPVEITNRFHTISSSDKYSRIKSRHYSILTILIAQFLPTKKKTIPDDEFRDVMTLADHLWCRTDDSSLLSILMEYKHFLEKSIEMDKNRKLPSVDYLKFPKIPKLIDSIAHLPYHVSTIPEIRDRVKDLKSFLFLNDFKKGGIDPLITIARSETDGHSPFSQVNFLLNEVYNMLYELYFE